MKKTSLIALLLVIASLFSMAACKKNENKEEESTLDFELETGDGYDYGTLDYEGKEFTFLQCDEGRWGMKTALAPTEFIGDEISDEAFRRNLKVETLYNVNILCLNRDIYETGDFIRTQCMNGEGTVDAAFVIGSSVAALISEGWLNDLSATPNLEIYEPWWNQRIRRSRSSCCKRCYRMSR